MLDRAQAQTLSHRLADVGYTLDATTDRLGDRATAALGRNTTLAARDALGLADDAQASLIRLFLLHDELGADAVAAALGDLGPLVESGVLVRSGSSVLPQYCCGTAS